MPTQKQVVLRHAKEKVARLKDTEKVENVTGVEQIRKVNQLPPDKRKK